MSDANMQAIGALQTSVAEAHRRLDDTRNAMRRELEIVRRELLGRLASMEKQRGKDGPRLPVWAHMLAIGGLMLTSILGLVKPEAAAAILRALLH